MMTSRTQSSWGTVVTVPLELRGAAIRDRHHHAGPPPAPRLCLGGSGTCRTTAGGFLPPGWVGRDGKKPSDSHGQVPASNTTSRRPGTRPRRLSLHCPPTPPAVLIDIPLAPPSYS